MRKRKYLIGATLGVLGALLVSATAFAGTQQSQTLQTTVSPTKLNKSKYKNVSLHNIISTQYDNFSASPSAKETIFSFGKSIKFNNGSHPACPKTTLQGATTTSAVQASCGSSVVGSGFANVNNRTGFFPNQEPVLLVTGGPTTLYVWVRIENGLTLVLTGAYSPSAHTLDVTGLPNTPGTDLTTFDTTFPKSSRYIQAKCSGKRKIIVSELTSYYGGPTLSATSRQKCKQV